MSTSSLDPFSAKKRGSINDAASKVDLTASDEPEKKAISDQSSNKRLREPRMSLAGPDDVDVIHYGSDLSTVTVLTEEEPPYSLKLEFFQDTETEKGIVSKGIGRLKGIIGRLWKGKLGDNFDGDALSYIKTSMRELLFYLGFVIIVCIQTLGVEVANPEQYRYTHVMKFMFADTLGFGDVVTVDGFWDFVNPSLIDLLYPEHEGLVLGENKLLGTPKIRQVRVKNHTCLTRKEIHKLQEYCYSPYSESDEDKNFNFVDEKGHLILYETSEQLNNTDVEGNLATYSGGGYVRFLGKTRAEAEKTLNYLAQKGWANRGTRAVFLDFSVYNANVNLFCVITLVFEFPPSGGLFTKSHFQTMKLLPYLGDLDKFVMACQVFLFFYALYYTLEEAIEIRSQGFSYFLHVWNCFDVLLILMSYALLIFIVYINDQVDEVLEADEPNFSKLSSWNSNFKQFDSVFVFLAMIKIFKYISFDAALTQLQGTIARCAADIASFSIMFFIVFLAYAQWGYLMFKGHLNEFSSFENCIYTLFRIILGDFDFVAMEHARRIMGPIYFMTYMFFVFFVLINMFVAIINDTYCEVKEEIDQEESFLSDYFAQGYSKMVNKISFQKEKIVDIQDALLTGDTNQDNVIDVEEFKAKLRIRGYEDQEIETVFSKYDVDGDKKLTEDEIKEMMGYFEEQKDELNREMERVQQIGEDYKKLHSNVSLRDASDDDYSDDESLYDNDEFEVLARRVDRIEQSIGNILSKIGSVLTKLEVMEGEKNKRRETLCRLLDSVTNEVDAESSIGTIQMGYVVLGELERWRGGHVDI